MGSESPYKRRRKWGRYARLYFLNLPEMAIVSECHAYPVTTQVGYSHFAASDRGELITLYVMPVHPFFYTIFDISASLGFISLVFGPLISLFLSEKYGRRRNLQLVLFIFTIGWTVILISQTFTNLVTGATLCGLAAGKFTQSLISGYQISLQCLYTWMLPCSRNVHYILQSSVS